MTRRLKNIFIIKKYNYNKQNSAYTNSQVSLPSHPFHIVDQSPWPLTLSAVLLCLTMSAVLTFHNYPMGNILLVLSFILLNWGMALWFKDIITEATFLGAHTEKVQRGISLGVALFIVSEVMFFLSIFWAYFHSALAPAIEIGSEWPPKGIEPVNASEVPTANTTLLLSSGSAVTVAHHSLVDRLIDWANNGSVATIYMALLFTMLQGMEYFGVSYTITDSVFGSTFYMGTGLILGPIAIYTKNLSLHLYGKILKFFNSRYTSRGIYLLNNNKHISPYWITGFCDGESSFIIRISKNKTKKDSWIIKPMFSIELHLRDLFLLENIQKFFGVGYIIIRNRKNENKKSVIYSVQSVKDINDIIIPHFTKYPLLTQKHINFKLFSLAINIVNNKEHLNIEGVKKILTIRASMNKGLTKQLKEEFPDLIPMDINKIVVNNKIKDPNWLTGFVDAEGCFYIKPVSVKLKIVKYSLVFSISQHSKDLLLMKKIKNI